MVDLSMAQPIPAGTESAHTYLSSRDEVLSKVISALDLPNIASTRDVFHDLIGCIVEQQVPCRSTKHIYERLLAKASITRLNPDNYADFEELALPSIKLSMPKLETMLRVVEFWQKNPIDWHALSDQEVRTTLSQIKGIGPWTIDMVLLYTLGRPDVFPADDYHLKLVMERMYGLDSSSRLKNQMKEVAENWAPHRSLAVRYLLEWKKSHNQGRK
jgi:DNA-3-methyladenine glycosylase II